MAQAAPGRIHSREVLLGNSRQGRPERWNEAKGGGPEARSQVLRIEFLDQERLGPLCLPTGYRAAISSQRQPLGPVYSALVAAQAPGQPEQVAAPAASAAAGPGAPARPR